MKIRTATTAGVTVCHIEGNLEYLTVPDLRPLLAELPAGRGLVFEMSGVAFVDSAGIGALVGAVRRARQAGADAVLCSPRPSVQRALTLVGLHLLVGIYGDEDEAVSALLQPAVA